MRLYEGLIPTISKEVCAKLIDDELIEVDMLNEGEFELDIQSVLREYVRMDREIARLARDRAAEQGGNTFKHKRKIARERHFKIGDDSLDYIINQLIEMFFHTNNVDDIFATDNDMRRTIAPVLKKHMNADTELDLEVRSKIKNLKEGTASWQIEYEKAMSKLKRVKKIE